MKYKHYLINTASQFIKRLIIKYLSPHTKTKHGNWAVTISLPVEFELIFLYESLRSLFSACLLLQTTLHYGLYCYRMKKVYSLPAEVSLAQ